MSENQERSPKSSDDLIRRIVNADDPTYRVLPQQAGAGREVVLIEVQKICTNRHQVRKVFCEDNLHGLADSIRAKGVIQPVSVRKTDDSRYELISGERRLRAAILAGLLTVPALIQEAGDDDMKILALIENIQREDLNVVEKTMAIGELKEELGTTAGDISQSPGLSTRSVERYLKIFKSVHIYPELVEIFESHAGQIDFKTAEALAEVAEQLAHLTGAEEYSPRKFLTDANDYGIKTAINNIKKLLSCGDNSSHDEGVFLFTGLKGGYHIFPVKCPKGMKLSEEEIHTMRESFSQFLLRLSPEGDLKRE
ncbi:MAG: ParB/RepB/Spo0J family partition protein [Thermodesulfovibrionales bacterium]|jgi:ParB/RepB/Spo0J family partition protein